MSENQKNLEVLIEQGNNKFIFIESDDTKAVISKSYAWHKEIYHSIEEKFDEEDVVAGGFINLDEDSKTIKITGSSGSYGSMDLDLIKNLIAPNFVGYTIETDMEEKRAYQTKVAAEKKLREDEKNEFLQDFSTFKQAIIGIQSKYKDVLEAKDAIEEKRLRFIKNDEYKKSYLSQIIKKASLLSPEAQDAIGLYSFNHNMELIQKNGEQGYVDSDNFYSLKNNLTYFKEGSTLKEEITLALVDLYRDSKTKYTRNPWSSYDDTLMVIANLYESIGDERFFETKLEAVKEKHILDTYGSDNIQKLYRELGFSKNEIIDIMVENSFIKMQNYSPTKSDLSSQQSEASFFLKNGRQDMFDELMVNAIRNQIENPPVDKDSGISVWVIETLKGLSEGALKEISLTYVDVLKNLMGKFNKCDEESLENHFEVFPEEVRQNMRTNLVERVIGSKHPSVVYSMLQSYDIHDESLLNSLASDALEKEDVSSKYVLAKIYSDLGKDEKSIPIWKEFGLKSLTSNPIAAEEALKKAGYDLKDISQQIGLALITSNRNEKTRFESTVLGIDYLLKEDILTEDIKSEVLEYASNLDFQRKIQLYSQIGKDTKETYLLWGDELIDSWNLDNFMSSIRKYSLAGLNREESVYRVAKLTLDNNRFGSSFVKKFSKLNPSKEQWDALANNVVELYKNEENKYRFNKEEAITVLSNAAWNEGTKEQINILADIYEQNVYQNQGWKDYSNLHKAISLRRKADKLN